MQGAILDKLALPPELEGKVRVGKVDIDKAPALAVRFGVQTIPTLIVFKDGQAVDTTVGVTRADVLAQAAARFDAIEQRQSSLAARIAVLERGSGDSGLASKDEVAAPRSDLAAVRSAQGRLRDEIVEDLSARISAIAKRQEQARAAGQTLSAIALAYKVSVKAIMQANNITDPTKLRVGQTLFIPDP